ncbi:MAG: hypothetical protein ACO28V_08100 [Chitinophagaceae bacterium]|jgi:hypothetical protein
MASFNKGDVSEGVLAAAITARFQSKAKRIGNDDVLNLIKKLGKPTKFKKFMLIEKEFDSPNKNPKIIDTVICKVTLAEVNMAAFLNAKIYADKEMRELLSAAVSYANGNNIMEWADMIYNNNQKNKIEVKSEGLLDQTGTKVDLRVIIDGKQAGVGVSLKAGDVKQFGQVGGATTDAMNEFFNPLGVKFSTKNLKDFETLVSKKQVTEALCLAYKEASKQIKELIKSDSSTFKKNISNFMKFHATRNEPDVALVQLSKNEANVYNFENIQKKLKGVELDVVYSEAQTDVVKGKKIPQLKIISPVLTKNNVLLQLRNKLEGNRIDSKGKKVGLTVRNYVEKGHLTTELLAETQK